MYDMVGNQLVRRVYYGHTKKEAVTKFNADKKRGNLGRARHRRSRPLGAVTKRDFTAIGDILCAHDATSALVSDVARYFKTQNPQFDRERFAYHVEKCKRR